MINTEIIGGKEAKKLMKKLMDLGNTVIAVEMNSKVRQGKEGVEVKVTNAEILGHMADSGRDFVTLKEREAERVDRVLVDTMSEHLDSAHDGKSARQVMTRALKKAGELWFGFIGKKIKDADWIGDGSKTLNKEYERQKKKDYEGRAYPIGVASGQLLANVGPNGARNLRFKKS